MKIIFGLSFSIYFILSLSYIFSQIIAGVLVFGFEGAAGSYLATLPIILGSWWLLWKEIFKDENFFDANRTRIFKIVLFSFAPILSFFIFSIGGTNYTNIDILEASLKSWYLFYGPILLCLLWLASQFFNTIIRNKAVLSGVMTVLCITSFFTLQLISPVIVAVVQKTQEAKSYNIQISNLKDYDLLTTKGNMFGIVLEYDLLFKKEIDRNVFHGLNVNTFSSLKSIHAYQIIEPQPRKNDDGADTTRYGLYSPNSYLMEPGITYHVKQYFLVSTVDVNGPVKPVTNIIDTADVCLNYLYQDRTDSNLLMTDAHLYSLGYKIDESLSHPYDVTEFFRTIVLEGVKTCGS